MNNELFNYIRSLTQKDKKTLSQKVVKTMEEVGELAREVLPYEGAAGTTHRFAIPDSILEESVDAILCLLSIAYETGATDDQIEKMLWKKSEYWNQLQTVEGVTKYPLPFEIHVTVEDPDQQKFQDACTLAGVKKINLNLYDINADVIKRETMTASKLVGNNKDAYNELNRICSILEKHDIKISRKKIETVPWHPAAVNGLAADGAYFETHFNLLVLDGAIVDLVRVITLIYSKQINGVLSLNTNKETGGYLVTIRDKSKDKILQSIENAKELLSRYLPDGFLMEYAIYDTNVSHDSSWINS
jgi:NTP pyrophosphatase (non-canonical NTP hydrolase)